MFKYKFDNIIGVIGKRLSGKDTCANYLVKTLPNFYKTPIANEIKYEYADLLNIDKNILFKQGPKKEEHRIGLITLGLVRRKDNPTYWCERVYNIYGKEKNIKNIIIPDIRYENEYFYFSNISKRLIIIEIIASKKIRKFRGYKPSETDKTASEKEYKKLIDYASLIIDNDGSLENLYKKLNDIKIFLD